MKTRLLIFLLGLSFASHAQVDQIKSQSSSNATRSRSSSGEGSSGSGGNGGGFWFVLRSFQLIGAWQGEKLSHRDSVPQMVSLELMPQIAVQPSSYYLALPRIRGNWGLFSTDVRYNYLLQDNGGSWSDLSTVDWQILELNLVTTRSVTGRIGAGVLRERFGANQSFLEWTAGVQIFPRQSPWGGGGEFRYAKDHTTQMVPRREFSLHLERQFLQSGAWHASWILGGVYQKYYESITVWAIQTGVTFRLY
ncbi:MAG: hypothetical protein K1X47_16980 [Cyclobacteriaceae bacterium]|nr:hypothetical protein [Cyclobacteriaceae bacterium]